jgi:hypothetical protein
VLEQILVRRIAAARIAEHQDRGGVGVTLLADAFPEPAEAVTGEFARIVAPADVDVSQVVCQIVDAVRDHDAGGPTGKVVIERLKRPLGPDAARAKELAQNVPWPWCRWKTPARPLAGISSSRPQSGGTERHDPEIHRQPATFRFCAAPVLGPPATHAPRGD